MNTMDTKILDYKPKMFREAEKNSGAESLPGKLIAFAVVFIIIMILESIAPTILTMPQISQLAEDPELARLEFGDRFKTMVGVTAGIMSAEPAVMIVSLFSTIFGILTSVVYCRMMELRTLSSMGFRKEKAGAHYLRGLLTGFCLMAAITGLSLVTGVNRIAFEGANAGLLLLSLAGFLVQGMSEEVIFRGYLMTTIGGSHKTWLAVAISAAAFSLAHAGNPGYGVFSGFNLALFGVFASMYIIAFDDIWGISAIHSIWNFTQGSLWGISVSGTDGVASIFRTTAKHDIAILTGGEFGIEGSIFTTIVLGAGVYVLWRRIQKKSNET
ncbi:MAG: CPBP family intramembrane metalloprotease [Ruminococcus sp.]|nr:CPBP family intramembrane metalloprotease [Ruminococcus sp.]